MLCKNLKCYPVDRIEHLKGIRIPPPLVKILSPSVFPSWLWPSWLISFSMTPPLSMLPYLLIITRSAVVPAGFRTQALLMNFAKKKLFSLLNTSIGNVELIQISSWLWHLFSPRYCTFPNEPPITPHYLLFANTKRRLSHLTWIIWIVSLWPF